MHLCIEDIMTKEEILKIQEEQHINIQKAEKERHIYIQNKAKYKNEYEKNTSEKTFTTQQNNKFFIGC